MAPESEHIISRLDNISLIVKKRVDFMKTLNPFY